MKPHLKLRLLGAVSSCFVAIPMSIVASSDASASIYNFAYTGVMTLQDSSGIPVSNVDAQTNSWYGYRTAITGTFVYDDVTTLGDVTANAFSFFGAGLMEVTTGATQGIGNGFGSSGNLMLGDFTYNWNGNAGVSMGIVWDASGFLDALSLGILPGDVISGDKLLIGGDPSSFIPVASALPASDSLTVSSGGGPGGGTPISIPIGPTPMATTAYDLTSGALPLITDSSGIGGSPQGVGPYPGFSMSIDIGNAGSLHLISISPSLVPVTATVWLFGSGLLALIGAVKRNKVV